MRNRDLRPAAKANPTIQQAFERFQKYNRLKNLSQGSLDFYAAKGRSFFRFLGDTEQPITTITEETVEDYIFYMKDQQLHDTTINTNLRMVRAFLYWCMEKGYLEKYPIRLVRADDPIKEPYTTDELQKLLKEPDCKTCSFAEYRNKDFLFNTLLSATRIVALQTKYYCYWTRENSATTRPFDKRWFDGYYFAKKIYVCICEKMPKLEADARYQLLSSCYFLVRQMDNQKVRKDYPSEYRMIKNEIHDLRIDDILNIISPQRRKGIMLIKYAPWLYSLLKG